MSRWVSLNQARANAPANSSGVSRKSREMGSLSGAKGRGKGGGGVSRGAGERVRELVGVLQEARRDRLVDRVEAQRKVGREHSRRARQRAVLGVGHGVRPGAVLRPPLLRPGRALGQLPLVTEEQLEEGV